MGIIDRCNTEIHNWDQVHVNYRRHHYGQRQKAGRIGTGLTDGADAFELDYYNDDNRTSAMPWTCMTPGIIKLDSNGGMIKVRLVMVLQTGLIPQSLATMTMPSNGERATTKPRSVTG